MATEKRLIDANELAHKFLLMPGHYRKAEIEVFNPYEAIKRSLKEAKIRHEKAYTDRGYLYIKSYNPYVHGVVGTDIRLPPKQKFKIIFSKGISVCIGDAIKNGRTDNGN